MRPAPLRRSLLGDAPALLSGTLLALAHIHPLVAAVAGGTVVGMGIVVLFCYRVSLGVVALPSQDRLDWWAGHVLLVMDALGILAARPWVCVELRCACWLRSPWWWP